MQSLRSAAQGPLDLWDEEAAKERLQDYRPLAANGQTYDVE